MPDTITNDVSRYSDDNIDDAAEALLKRWNINAETGQPNEPKVLDPEEEARRQAGKVEQPEDGGDHNEQVDEDDDTPPEEGDEEEEEQDKTPVNRRAAADEDEVEIKVGDDTHKVPVKDLKRLWGQEAALTQKSQETARVRSQAEQVAVKHGTALNAMLARAQERLKPFENVDWAVAQNNLSKEDFAQLRAYHKQASDDAKYFEAELAESAKAWQEQQQAMFQEAATTCIKELEDPEKGIKGWNKEMYGELRQYAIDGGIPQQMIDSLVTPAAFKFLHKAMLYDKALKTGAHKVVTAPRNVNKTQGRTGVPAKQAAQNKAMDSLRRSGSPEDAAE